MDMDNNGEREGGRDGWTWIKGWMIGMVGVRNGWMAIERGGCGWIVG